MKAPDNNTLLPNEPQPIELLELSKKQPFHFGKCEVEIAAKLLTEFFAETGHGYWRYFSLEELSTYCISKGHKSAGNALFGLICGWVDDGSFSIREPRQYITQLDEGSFCPTVDFVRRLAGKN